MNPAESVKRYEFKPNNIGGTYGYGKKYGAWVKFTDYEVLDKRCEKLFDDNVKLSEMVANKSHVNIYACIYELNRMERQFDELKKYAYHLNDCDLQPVYGRERKHECSCGLNKALGQDE